MTGSFGSPGRIDYGTLVPFGDINGTQGVGGSTTPGTDWWQVGGQLFGQAIQWIGSGVSQKKAAQAQEAAYQQQLALQQAEAQRLEAEAALAKSQKSVWPWVIGIGALAAVGGIFIARRA